MPKLKCKFKASIDYPNTNHPFHIAGFKTSVRNSHPGVPWALRFGKKIV
jgi:hypothetical protein